MHYHGWFKSYVRSPDTSGSPLVFQQSVGKQIPNDALLREVAQRAQRKDWPLLANKLEFVQADIDTFTNQHPRDKQEQVSMQCGQRYIGAFTIFGQINAQFLG